MSPAREGSHSSAGAIAVGAGHDRGAGGTTPLRGTTWSPSLGELALAGMARQPEPVWLEPAQIVWSLDRLATVTYLVSVASLALGTICAWCTALPVLIVAMKDRLWQTPAERLPQPRVLVHGHDDEVHVVSVQPDDGLCCWVAANKDDALDALAGECGLITTQAQRCFSLESVDQQPDAPFELL